MRLAGRSLVLLLGAAALSACAYGRSAQALRETAYGRMPPPPGSALASEAFSTAEWNIDGPICAVLYRTYASNDANAFLATVVRIGRERNAKYVIAKPPLIFNDDLPGLYSPGASVDDVDGTSVSLDFHDLDDPDYRAPSWIDARAWRFVIEMRISDDYDTQGGGCHL